MRRWMGGSCTSFINHLGELIWKYFGHKAAVTFQLEVLEQDNNLAHETHCRKAFVGCVSRIGQLSGYGTIKKKGDVHG